MNGIPVPNILDRSEGLMRLQFRNDPSILGYRIRVANTLDNAYGAFNGVPGTGTTALFDVQRGRSWISKGLRQQGRGILGETTRGQTRATFDPTEYFGVSPEVPPDSNLWFVRTQVATAPMGGFPLGFPGGAFPGTTSVTDESKILIVQDPVYFSVPRPALSLYATAPDLASAVPGLPAPVGAMVFGVPAFADALVITNHGGSALYFAVARDQPLMQINPGSTISHASGMKDELVFCASGANPNFSVLLSTVSGDR